MESYNLSAPILMRINKTKKPPSLSRAVFYNFNYLAKQAIHTLHKTGRVFEHAAFR